MSNTTSTAAHWHSDAFQLHEATIASLQEAMACGHLSAQSIVKLYLTRINTIDKAGPSLNSVIELNPDALQIAADLDRERREKGPRGPLHGIPVMLKDSTDTGDRMKTSAGSLALAESIAPCDAFYVERLRKAGIVILGKTNMSEWSNYRSMSGCSGWSARGGLTSNPYVLGYDAEGSSSGSAVAVSSNLCTIAIGAETWGSIVSPSACNSIVGIKPTVGLISRSGVIPISPSADSPGPMARTVTDAAVLLGAMTGIDPRDERTSNSEGHTFTDYTQFLNPNELQGARIGVVHSYNELSDNRSKTLFHEVIKVLQAQGTTIINPIEVTDLRLKEVASFFLEGVIAYEFKHSINKYLAGTSSNVKTRTLADLITFNEVNKDVEMPWFDQSLFLASQSKGSLDSEEYIQAVDACRHLTQEKGIDAMLDSNKLDALVSLTARLPSKINLTREGPDSPNIMIMYSAAAGYPVVTVPIGFVQGLPVGMSLFGRAWSEPKLIALAYSIEQAIMARKAPTFRSTVE
jgi:amidase